VSDGFSRHPREPVLSQETVLELGNIVKKSVEQQKMLAWQYNTIGVSDGITMGGDGESRTGTPP
jgi:dihydroxyacid dehydratase/phosphogluconate dehydratase